MTEPPPRWAGIPRAHPRLLGGIARLRALARERPEAYARTAAIARHGVVSGDKESEDAKGSDPYGRITQHAKLVSMALVAAIDGDARLARETVDTAFAWYLDQPVWTGHVTFGHVVGECALVYDLLHPRWTDAERARFYAYFNETRDRNLEEEPSPFHNGWWGYKNGGFGIACIATMWENPRAGELMAALDAELAASAHPALELSGYGGCFSEGFYTHYWNYDWQLFCENARLAAGVDLYEDAPAYWRHRAVGCMFEMYPGLKERASRQGVCFGDGHGRRFGPERERDKARASRDMLIARYRDADHRAVAAFQAATPRCGADENAYKDFLWHDPTVAPGDLKGFKLSHVATGPGMVHARSSWGEDATYFAFKSGKRFSTHAHLDQGHFFIYRHEELAGRGGHYVDFAGDHDVNYYIRSIAHNSILVHDPAEVFPHFMKGHQGQPDNDGGQAWPWVGTPFRHNGCPLTVEMWRAHPELGDSADLLAAQDEGGFLYVAGDCTRAYAAKKMQLFTREIVFIRPGTFVVFDRVRTTDPSFRTTFVLQAMKPPTGADPELVITNGRGRLTMQTLLPERRTVTLHQGADLYRYGGKAHPPARDSGPCAECRIEVDDAERTTEHRFLHVLTAADAGSPAAPRATLARDSEAVVVTVGGAVVRFAGSATGGSVAIGGRATALRRMTKAESYPW